MSSAPTDCRVPDPTDAKADGNFGNHRAGYSPDKLANAEYWARKGGTLAAGEGLVLVQEIDRLREQLKYAQALLNQLHDSERLQDEIDRLRGKLELVNSEAADAYHAIDRRDEELAQQSITLGAEYQQAERILWALVNPSPTVLHAMASTFDVSKSLHLALKTASQEVAGDR